MDNINLPKDIIQHIKGFIPRDSHMSHPTAALLKNPYAWYHHFANRFPYMFYEDHVPLPLTRFMRGTHPVIQHCRPDDSDDEDD